MPSGIASTRGKKKNTAPKTASKPPPKRLIRASVAPSARFLFEIEEPRALPMAIAEGANSKLGKSLYDAGCGGTWAEVKTYLTQLQTSGAIRGADNRFVAAHLKG